MKANSSIEGFSSCYINLKCPYRRTSSVSEVPASALRPSTWTSSTATAARVHATDSAADSTPSARPPTRHRWA